VGKTCDGEKRKVLVINRSDGPCATLDCRRVRAAGKEHDNKDRVWRNTYLRWTSFCFAAVPLVRFTLSGDPKNGARRFGAT